MGESRAASTAAGSSPASLLAVQPELETTLADGPTTLTGAQADGHAPPAGIQTNFMLRTTSRWSEWSQDKTKKAYAIAKTCASKICDTVKNAAKAVNNTTKQVCDKIRGKSQTKLPEIPTDDQMTPSCETQCVDGKSSAAAAALKRRRLQNRPKSHVVVLERLLEEIRESERNCK